MFGLPSGFMALGGGSMTPCHTLRYILQYLEISPRLEAHIFYPFLCMPTEERWQLFWGQRLVELAGGGRAHIVTFQLS